MKKEMLINVAQPEECRIAILENGVLEELYVERSGHENYVGNIYKGRIVNIEPSIQAAFVDFGVGRNGFLHISDVEPMYYQHLEARRDRGDRNDRSQGRDRDRGRGRDRDRDRDRPPARPAPVERDELPPWDVEQRRWPRRRRLRRRGRRNPPCLKGSLSSSLISTCPKLWRCRRSSPKCCLRSSRRRKRPPHRKRHSLRNHRT